MRLLLKSRLYFRVAIFLLLSCLAKGEQKNVLVFFIDDLRPELGCYGVDSIKSPHIDELASEGTAFDRAYCQQAICAPSRISMMTGQYPDTLGIYDLWTPVRAAIPDVVTLPSYFKERGYFTGSYGKVYHHGRDDTVNWTDHRMNTRIKYADPEVVADIERRRKEAVAKGLTKTKLSGATKGPAIESADVPDNHYEDGRVAEAAIESLRQVKEQGEPFLLCVGFAKPHLPFAVPKRYWDLYDREEFSVPEPELPNGLPKVAITKWGELRSYLGIPKEGLLSPELTQELRHGYAASVSYADAQVGKVMAELKRLELHKDTIVVLWGDHGYKLGEYGLWCKHTNLELDTRVPFIIAGPGLPKGQRSSSYVEMVDIFPTVAQFSGGQIPASCEGKSLLPVLEEPRKQVRPYALSQYPRGTVVGYSMRKGPWRYTEWINKKTKEIQLRELYKHEDSQVAKANLAGSEEHQETVTKLSALLNSKERIERRAERN